MGYLERYLELLVGDETDGFVEIRWREPGGVMSQRFVPVAARANAATVILGRAPTADVYVGCAPRTRRGGGLDSVDRVHWLWADVDSPEAAQRLASFEPDPPVIIASGSPGHRHVYWPLAEPLGAAEAGRAMLRLQARLDSDPAATHAAQILRPPGTLSHKRDPALAVSVEQMSGERFDLATVLADTPELANSPGWGRELGPTLRRSSDPIRRIKPAHYVEVLTGSRPNHLGKVPCPFHSDSDPSLHVYNTPEGGWFCFGCRRGTDIYVLAGALWGLSTRGPDFLELRRRLRQQFLEGRPQAVERGAGSTSLDAQTSQLMR